MKRPAGHLVAWAAVTAAAAAAGALGLPRALGGAGWALWPGLWAAVPAALWLAGRPVGGWGISWPPRPARAAVETAATLGAVVAVGALYAARLPAGSGPGGGVLYNLLWVAPAEELFFRGWLQAGLRAAWGPRAAALLSAALFGASHAILRADPAATITAVPGLLFAAARERHGSLLTPILLHGAANAAVIAWQAG